MNKYPARKKPALNDIIQQLNFEADTLAEELQQCHKQLGTEATR